MQVSLFPTAAAVTMTSLELVDFINSQRAPDAAELSHDHFMAKVPKVLGEGGAPNFRDTYRNAQNGQTYPCYRFPKREACLMAMSYSYELQAKVFDRMTELEAAAAAPVRTALAQDPAVARLAALRDVGAFNAAQFTLAAAELAGLVPAGTFKDLLLPPAAPAPVAPPPFSGDFAPSTNLTSLFPHDRLVSLQQFCQNRKAEGTPINFELGPVLRRLGLTEPGRVMSAGRGARRSMLTAVGRAVGRQIGTNAPLWWDHALAELLRNGGVIARGVA